MKSINNKNREKKSKYLDILIILLIIGVSICLHIPSYRYTEVDKKLISEYEDENGVTYLHEMDSYYFARQAHDFPKEDNLRGHVEKSEKGAASIFLPVLVNAIWRVVNLFFKKLSFMRFISFIGPLLSSLACIPAYIFVKKRTNVLGGFAAGFTAATSSAFFGDNGFGCFDTDLLLFILPLIFGCSYIESLQDKSFKKQLIWIGVLSLSYILLAYTWGAHIIYYFLAVGLSLLFILITLIKEKFNFKKCIKYSEFKIPLIIIILLTIITLIVDKTINLSYFSFLLNMLKEKGVFLYDAYPDPGKYVSELGSVPIFGVINDIGGLFVSLASFITLIYLFKRGIKYINEPSCENKKYFIMFLVLFCWVFGGLICLKAGSRFIKIVAVPLSLIIGLGMGDFYNLLIKKKTGLMAILLTIAIVVSGSSVSALRYAKQQQPAANDALTDISDWIRKNTSSHAVIISWWDYGYYYEYKAQRMTVADGGTFDGRFYYWLSNIFITEDEDLSYAISKMIAYSGVKASTLADEYAGSAKLGCEMLKEILVLNKDDAKKVLKDKYKLKDNEIKKLLSYTHTDKKREIIIVVTSDMLDKSGPISYYANYDFTDKNNEASYVSSDFMLYRFYHNQNIKEHFVHLKDITDPTEVNSGRIWQVVD